MFIVQRVLSFLWIIVLIIMLLLSSMNLSWLFDLAGDGVSGPSESAEVVEEDGFTLTLDGVTVEGDATVAPLGTPIRARLITPKVPEAVDEFADPVGTGVEVILGDGVQPASPLTITFAPNEVSAWYAANDSEDAMPVVFATKDEAPGVEFADAHLQADGSVVVYADHLSEFVPSTAYTTRFGNWFTNQVEIAMQVRSKAPTCVDQQAEDLEWTVSYVPDKTLWTCLNETPDGLELTLTNNSPQVWLVSSAQATPGHPVIASIQGTVFTESTLVFVDLATTAPIMPPDGSVSFSISEPEGEIVFHVVLHKSLTGVNAVINAVSPLLPSKKVKALGKAECMVDILSEAVSGDDQMDGGRVGTITRCVGDLTEGLAGTFISTAMALPGSITALVNTTERHESGTDQFIITISKVETSGVSAWPTGRDDGPGVLYTWLGASMMGFPDWVACDDAGDWCLVGYDGDTHVLVDMNELEAIAGIEDSVTDPRRELLELGLPENVVNEILGD